MIVNIRNEIFNELKTNLSNVAVLSEYPSTTPTFPCIVFEEIVNDTYTGSIDTDGENHNNVGFEINIFSNSQNKISDVLTIRSDVDAIIGDQYGMNRSISRPTPNYMDLDIYRYTMRYDAVVDENKRIYRR